MTVKNMNNIKVYTATKSKKEDSVLYKCLNDNKHDSEITGYEVYFKENNKESLQKCYNSFLEDARRNCINIAVFIHDDVYINTRDFYNLVSSSAEKFQVFGLAGASTCKVNSPALWHLMSEKQSQLGCVAHGTKDSYMYTSFGPVNKRTLLIDGVFIGINIKQLPDKVKFDESYPSRFHFYDLDFCLECNKNGITMGIVDIPIIHSSPGLTKPDKEFYDGQQYFINKWKR